MVDELSEPGDVLPRALEVAGELAALPRSAYEPIKRQLRGDAIEAMERLAAEDPLERGWVGEEAGEAVSGILRERE